MNPTTAENVDFDILLATMQRIDERLARLEDFISRYEPFLGEATRRMKGPMSWRKG